MIQFDDNGKPILPGQEKGRQDEEKRLWENYPAIRINRWEVSRKPGKCKLIIEANNLIANPRMIEMMFNAALRSSYASGASINQLDARKYEVIIDNDWKRCSFCTQLRAGVEGGCRIINSGYCDKFGGK